MAQYLAALPPDARRRTVLHQHHDLAKQSSIGGIHYREAERPPGVIKAPPGLSGGLGEEGQAGTSKIAAGMPSPCASATAAAVSTSFHTLPDLGVCRGEVDYCFLSPIYASISKPGYGEAAFPDPGELAGGLAGSRYPVLALGGVTRDKFGELAELGFAGAALLGAVWAAEDPLAAWEAAVAEAARLG